MKLALVISSLAAGGAERVLSTLANCWSERGHNVTIVTDAAKSLDHYPLSQDIKRVELHLQSHSTQVRDKIARNVRRVLRLRAEIKGIAPDIVIAFGDTVNVRAILSCLGTGVPVLVSERVDPRQHALPMPWRLLRRLVYPFAEAVIVQTESVARWAHRFVSAKRVHVIPNPARSPSVQPLRPEILRGRRTVIAVGRLSPQKGFDLLLRAFSCTGLSSAAWQLVILGDGPERAALEEQVCQLKLSDSVRMVGIVTEPQHWLQHADLFVLSSRFEGFPNALLEAMSCGLPVVAFDCPSGPAEIVRHEQTGLLVPLGDVDSLTTAIARLALDSALSQRLGAAAAADVAQRFDLNRVAALWETTLARLFNRHSPGFAG